MEQSEEKACRRAAGFGCSSDSNVWDGNTTGSDPSVKKLLSIGLPTLALASLRGEMVPFNYVSKALFPAVDATTQVPQVNPANSSERATVDTFCNSVDYVILNQSETANAQIQSSESDFYFNHQSGIEIAVRIMGSPGWNPMAAFTPITSLKCVMGNGWPLRATEWPQMDVLATILLPFICSVQVTWCMNAPRCTRPEYSLNRLAVDCLEAEYGIKMPGG